MPCRGRRAVCQSEARLDGKTALITGGNSGIGKETAVDLADRGARVLLACRSKSRAETAADEIRERSGNPDVVVYNLDLASLQSVRDCAAEITKNEHRLNILVNSAGVLWIPTRELTKDGFEMQFGTNHLGHFLLTHLLLDLLKKSAPSRIVIVSSSEHTGGHLDFTNLQSEKSYDKGRAYSNSKLANIFHARELARRLKGTKVTANSLHPGFVKTELFRSSTSCRTCAMPLLFKCFARSPTEGAQTCIYLAVSEQVEGVTGKYFTDCAETLPSRRALDDVIAKRLWEVSENLVGVASNTKRRGDKSS